MEAPGSIPHPGSSEGGHQQARRNEVFDYILTSLPLERRQAFDEALRADRGLVERESDPLRYLRFESGRVSAAGDRLASYWEERKKIFQERFLLPMTVTGQGALDERSLQVISAGVMLFLPDDVKGRSVLYLDHEVDISHNLTGMEVRLFRGRVRFYLLHRAVERGRPLVCLRYTRSSDLDKAKVMAFQRYLRFFPVTLESLVLVYHVPAAASRVFNDTVIPLMSQYLKELPERVSIAHVLGSTSKELGEKLKKLHFTPKGIPEKIGGRWSWDNFETWLKARRDIEGMEDSKPPASETSTASQSRASLPPAHALPPITTAEDRIRMAEERRNRKRQKDLEYSRDRRVREKGECGTIQGQVDALQRTNLMLRAEESRLCNLLNTARVHVEIYLYGKPLSTPAGGALSTPPRSGQGAPGPSQELPLRMHSHPSLEVAPNHTPMPPPAGGLGTSRRSPEAASARETSAVDLVPTGYERGMGVPIHTMSVGQLEAAARGVPTLDLFSRYTIQPDRIHTVVPSYGMMAQFDDRHLALLIQRQQQHPHQPLNHHPLAFQPALPPFQQLDPLLRGNPSQGLVLSQLGALPPYVGVPIMLSSAPQRAYHEPPPPGTAGGDSRWILAEEASQHPAVAGVHHPTQQLQSPPPALPGRGALDAARQQGEAASSGTGPEPTASGGTDAPLSQQQYATYPLTVRTSLLSPHPVLAGDYASSLYHLQQQQNSLYRSSSSFGEAGRERGISTTSLGQHQPQGQGSNP